MSFKRDTDSKSWFENLRKRRVNELLTEEIAEDEAALLKNGRLACLVCHHRPVFDTLDMMVVHREGSKHKYNSKHFYAQKEELEELKRQRAQQILVSTGEALSTPTSKGQSSSSDHQHRLLAHPVYNACASRPKLRPHQRKETLRLSTASTSSVDASATSPDTTQGSKGSKRKRKKVSHPSSLDSDFKPFNLESLTYKAPKRDESTEKSDERKEYVNKRINSLMNKVEKANKPSAVIGPQALPPEMEEKKEFMKKYVNALSSGWKRDRGGQWVKDDDVEFDSDEEPPDITLPPQKPAS